MGKEFIFLSQCHVTTYSNSDNFASRFSAVRSDDEFVTATTRRRKPQRKRTRDKMRTETEYESLERIARYNAEAFESRGIIIQELSQRIDRMQQHCTDQAEIITQLHEVRETNHLRIQGLNELLGIAVNDIKMYRGQLDEMRRDCNGMTETIRQLRTELSEAKQAVLLGILDS